MKKLVMNPYMPFWEYVPDGEPHVFGERVYVYGSHDRFAGSCYCQNDYVCWSAPVTDLSDWRCEGVIYRKTQDPRNPEGKHSMWAPDVTRGPDGRFYLYYCLDFLPAISVAVAEVPAGPYRYYGQVCRPDGVPLGEGAADLRQTDPAVLTDEDGQVYLYSGGGSRYNKDIGANGSQMMALEPDMLTVRGEVLKNLPTIADAEGTPFADRPFYEASAIRRFDGKYYFIYSSTRSHDLCWTVSEKPLGPFRYGGILVSNGDVGLPTPEGGVNESPRAYWGNTHGCVEKIGDGYYVFYHRQTNQSPFSRQACAEPIRFENGAFTQAPITSTGLYGEPFPGKGTYPAAMACYLTKNGVAGESGMDDAPVNPRITQTGPDYEPGTGTQPPESLIAGMRDGASAGFVSFRLERLCRISCTLGGTGEGSLFVTEGLPGENRAPVAVVPVHPGERYKTEPVALALPRGVHNLIFTYRGTGAVCFYDFTLAPD